MELVFRVALVLAVVVAAFVGTGMAMRRRGPAMATSLSAGVVVVTGPGCRLCGPAIAALEREGASPRLVGVSDPSVAPLGIRSLPTALVIDGAGTVVLRRSGRAAVDDAAIVARTAAVQAL